MAKWRQIQGFDDFDFDVDAHDESETLVQRVQIRQSPYLDAFKDHFPIRLTIDSGATGNMVKASCDSRLGAKITASSQSAHHADGSSLLKVVGETRLVFNRYELDLFF